jgi:uncharacterized protein
MPTRNKYAHGTFSWVDLGTNNPQAAKKFYGALLGWTFADMPAGPGMTYTMCKLGDHDAAALYELGPDMKGVPPHWMSYVTVNDIEVTTKKAAQNGGTVVKDVSDVMDVGRMSLIQDPTGAMLAFWQAKKHAGAGIVQEPGSLTWNELFTNDVDRAGKFYVQTLGWTTQAVDMGPMGIYTLFNRPGDDANTNAGGMLAIPPNMKGVPPHWLAYFAVTDCDASAKQAMSLGGQQIVPPTDIPKMGRFAVLQDPQGAVFAIFQTMH